MRIIYSISELFRRTNITASALSIRINSGYFSLILLRKSMDENCEITVIRSRNLSNSLKIVVRPGLGPESIAAIIYLTQDAKSTPLFILQLRNSVIRVISKY
jgi:hypothetical protein